MNLLYEIVAGTPRSVNYLHSDCVFEGCWGSVQSIELFRAALVVWSRVRTPRHLNWAYVWYEIEISDALGLRRSQGYYDWLDREEEREWDSHYGLDDCDGFYAGATMGGG